MTVTVYLRTNRSKRPYEQKLVDFLDNHNIPYQIKAVRELSHEHLNKLLEYSNGLDDLVTTKRQYGELTLNDIYHMIRQGKITLKTPLAVEGNKTLIGYNDEEVRIFIPREVRNQQALQNAAKAASMFGLEFDERLENQEYAHYQV